MTTDTRPKTTVRTGTAGRSAAWPRAPACSPRASPPCSACSPPTRSPARRARRGAARGHPADLRPDRLRRLHVHQRHRAAAGQRRLRPRARRGRADRGRHRGLPRPGPAADRRRGGRHQARPRSRWSAPRPRTTRSRSAAAVARNNLVKTALFGNDPNWGRILAAVGTTAAAFEPDAVDVAVNGVWVCRGGAAAEDRSKVDLSGRAVTIRIDLHAGDDDGDDLDQRPVPRVRARELGVLDMTVDARRTHRDTRPAQGRDAHRGAALAGALRRRPPSSSSTAATRWSTTSCAGRSRPTWSSCGSPASSRSWCTAAARRSPRCSAGSASPASSGAGCG